MVPGGTSTYLRQHCPCQLLSACGLPYLKVDQAEALEPVGQHVNPDGVPAAAGDRWEVAAEVAAEVGIPRHNVHAGVKPAGKAQLIERLMAEGRLVTSAGQGQRG